MKPTQVTYSKLVNLGSYSNERYDVQLTVEEGDHIQEVIKSAREMVEIAIEARRLEEEKRAEAEAAARREKKLEWARVIMTNPAAHGTWDVREASELLGVPFPFGPAPQTAGEDVPF